MRCNAPSRDETMTHSFRVIVPATTANLGPGFDCLGMALSLYNEIEVIPLDAPPDSTDIVEIEGEGSLELPCDDRNMIVYGMHRVFTRAGVTPPSFMLKTVNHIPMMSGLGSSSAAIVGGIVAGNELIGNPLSRNDLLTLATEMEGHPDNVGPALLGGLIVAVATADIPIITQVEVPPLQAVIVTPELRVATDEARRILPPMLSRHDAIYNIGRAALVVQALSKGDFDLLGRAMDDRLHQPYRKHLIKGYDDVVSAAKAAGASAVAISGSGPTLIAFAPDRHKAIAHEMRQAFAVHEINSRAWVLEVDRLGARRV
jgi:homoserine kinase